MFVCFVVNVRGVTLGSQRDQHKFSYRGQPHACGHRPPSLSESDERISEQYESLVTMECAVPHGEVRASPASVVISRSYLLQVVYRIADIALPPFDPRNPLHPRVSSALASTFRAFVHPWNTHPSLGIAATLRHAGSHAPIPPPCLFQCLLTLCSPSAGHCSQLVGQNIDVFGTNLCSHGGSL